MAWEMDQSRGSIKGGLASKVGQCGAARGLGGDGLRVGSLHLIDRLDDAELHGRATCRWPPRIVEALGGGCGHKIVAPKVLGGPIAGQRHSIGFPDREIRRGARHVEDAAVFVGMEGAQGGRRATGDLLPTGGVVRVADVHNGRRARRVADVAGNVRYELGASARRDHDVVLISHICGAGRCGLTHVN